MQLFVPAVLKTSCDTDCKKKKKQKQKTVHRKYFEATSSQHAQNVLVAKDFIYLLLKYAFQKAHFFPNIT
jgi:hypothetical protein